MLPKEHSPLVEVGAGTGYWAALLRGRGARVFAYDRDPPPAPCTAYYVGRVY